MSERPLSSWQAAILMFMIIIGTSMVYVPVQAVKQDAWISSLIGMFSGLFIILALIKLNTIYPAKSISQIAILLFGKIFGNILNLIFMVNVFIISLSVLEDLANLLSVIYPQTPTYLLQMIIVAVCIYMLYMGPEIICRIGELFIWPVLFFLGIGLIIPLDKVDFSHFFPIWESWRPIAAGVLLIADWPFNEIAVLGLFLFNIKEYPIKKKPFIIWYFLAAGLLLGIETITILILGPELTDYYTFPVFEIYRLDELGTPYRIELLFLTLWFSSATITLAVFYYSTCYLIKDIFNLKEHKSLLIPIGLSILVIGNYLTPNDFAYKIWIYMQLPFFTFPVNLLYPSIILGAALLKNKSGQSAALLGREK